MKRVLLFVTTNLAILVVVGIFLNVVLPMFGIYPQGKMGLLLICAVFGMGGAFVSLALSKTIAVKSTGAYVIEEPGTEGEQWLVNTVARQAEKAGIGMPDVAIFNSQELNAFATGMNRNNSLVAVSTGLLQNMAPEEVQAVLGHEVSHIANGDMVTLTLIQGVLNTFVFFLARLVASAVTRGRNSFGVYFLTVMLCQVVFGMFASMIVMWFSRYREFRADAGGSELSSRQNMAAALKRLQAHYEQHVEEQSVLDGKLAAFGINGKRTSLAELFMSHPPLEQRIAALENQA